MFWGLIMEPNKRYTQVVEKPFHISQAAIDISTGDNDPCQVMVVVDGKNFLVCTLQKNRNVQVPLDLYFKAGDSIAFLTNGKCNIHLTGYLDPEYEEEDEESDEEEEQEEAPTLASTRVKRKLDNSDDTTGATKKTKPSKKAPASESSDEEEDDDEDQLQKFLDGEDMDTDENDESFKVNTSAEASESDEEEESAEEEDDNEEGDEEENGKEESEDEEADNSKEENKLDTSKLTKSQKRRLKKKLQKEKQNNKKPQENGIDKSKKEKPGKEQTPEKKKESKKEAKDAESGDKKEKKTLSGGVYFEDIKVGSGPVAKPGKTVLVYYEGRLKQNNKMFDNCMKGAGFKFRLGAKEVITGWDVGIAGMKVGGKRKLVCPPAMAYGAKGSPPVIPPNSTLVFEVELKNIK